MAPTNGKSGQNKFMCTSCGKNIMTYKEARKHPVLDVLQCITCHSSYNLVGDLTKYRGGVELDGQDNYCRWCLDGGELLLCNDENCRNGFCNSCIQRNLGSLEEISQSQSWYCFICDDSQLKDLRQTTERALNILKPSIKLKMRKSPIKIPTKVPVPKKVSDPVPKKVSDPVPKKVSDPVPTKVSDSVPTKVSESVRPKVSDPVPTKVLDSISTKVSDPVPTKISDPIRTKVSDSVSTEVSVEIPAETIVKDTAEPVEEPTVKPTNKPAVKFTVKTPIESSVKTPFKNPVKTPVKTPVKSPVEPNIKLPVEPTIDLTVEPPVKLPVESTVDSVVKLPVEPTVESTAEPIEKPPVEQASSESPVKAKVLKTQNKQANFFIFSTSRICNQPIPKPVTPQKEPSPPKSTPPTPKPTLPSSKPASPCSISHQDIIKALDEEMEMSDDDSSDDPFVEAFESLPKTQGTSPEPMEVDQPPSGPICWALRDAANLKQRLQVHVDALTEAFQTYDEDKFVKDPKNLSSWLSNIEAYFMSSHLITGRCRHINDIIMTDAG